MAVFLGRGIPSSFTPPPETGIFDDVSVSWWAADWIEQFYKDSITTDCNKNPLEYCPGADVTRAQMAIFLLRSKHGKNYKPSKATGIFTDVPVTHWAVDWIEQLTMKESRQDVKNSAYVLPWKFGNPCSNGGIHRPDIWIVIDRFFLGGRVGKMALPY